MRSGFRFVAGCVLVLQAFALQAAKSYDVLDLPAVQSPLAAHALIYSLTRAGDRIVATGIRGHILYSDDFGHSWTQADSVPVRSSLLDAHFPTPGKGWVVGHEGVILHSVDGGRNWVRQLDGRQLANIGLDHYRARFEAEPDNERYAFLLEEMQLAAEQGADRPFFRVLMQSETSGFAIGAYGLLFATHDAGQSWLPVMEVLDMDQMVHLFDLAVLQSPQAPGADNGDGLRQDIVVSGEMGTILAVDAESGQWQPQDFPYEGSMFSLLSAADGSLVTGGLRGLVFRSTDNGRSWVDSAKPPTGAVVAGTVLADGRVVLATQEGNLLLSADNGASFSLMPVERPLPLSDVLEGRAGELILSGVFGVRVIAIDR